MVGSYRVVSLLGEGGMGAVYLGEHRAIGGRVAIKALHPRYAADPETVARFFNEARAVNLVQHQNIVQVVDFIESSPLGPCLVMEYLAGESLADRLARRGRLELVETAAILARVASALDAAHARGIVHRDLKPANIFLVPDADRAGEDRVKVLDFGIAKLGESSQTQTHQLMGTPIYMSPEQCHGAKHVDPRSDLYALAVIAYECLCGRPPFLGPGLGQLIAEQLRSQPPPPRTLRADLPAGVEAAILRGLEKDPARRPASALELITALGETLAGTHAPALAPTLPPRPGAIPATQVDARLPFAPAQARPPAEVPDHLGRPQPPGADFFVPPPAELGPLRSAATDLVRGHAGGRARPIRAALLSGLAAGGLLFVILLVVLLAVGAGVWRLGPAIVTGPLFFFVVGAVVGWRQFRFAATCNYVGERGLATFSARGRRERIVASARLEFGEVAELRVLTRRLTRNGAYAGTRVELRWYDASGLERFHLLDTYSDRVEPSPSALHLVARSAELAWTRFILPRLAQAFEAHGSARFMLGTGDALELTPGGLRVELRGKQALLPSGELEPFSVENGLFSIRRRGATRRVLFGDPAESFSFSYDSLANAQAFLALAERTLGPAVVPPELQVELEPLEPRGAQASGTSRV